MNELGAPEKLRLPLAGPSFEQRVARKRERVHVLTGEVCNNNCIFCMEEDREGRRVVNGTTDDALLDWILRENPDAEEICFTSGEPTTRKELPGWVKKAKAAGIQRISIMTNARALAYERYAKGLVAAGISRFYVSIHGHTAKLHDSLVRTPGAFEQTTAGIAHIARLARYGVELHTSTVLTRRNLPHLQPIYRFLRERGVDQVVFNVMQANGRANTHFERIFPTYTETGAAFREFVLAEQEREDPVMAFLVDIPPCATEGVPDFNRGFVESYVHYEPSVENHGQQLPGMELGHGPQGDLAAVRRSDLDGAVRTKRDECRSCRYDSVCEGVWMNYLRRHGWDELQPVRLP
ncbi:MAG: hypothetical protein CMN30_07995 [Sandaracinus sp.]|nr:hypothetical protein [Sandaracinus sp.]